MISMTKTMTLNKMALSHFHSRGQMVEIAQGQRKPVRVRPLQAGAADHGVHAVMEDVGPDAVPEELHGAPSRRSRGAPGRSGAATCP